MAGPANMSAAASSAKAPMLKPVEEADAVDPAPARSSWVALVPPSTEAGRGGGAARRRASTRGRRARPRSPARARIAWRTRRSRCASARPSARWARRARCSGLERRLRRRRGGAAGRRGRPAARAPPPSRRCERQCRRPARWPSRPWSPSRRPAPRQAARGPLPRPRSAGRRLAPVAVVVEGHGAGGRGGLSQLSRYSGGRGLDGRKVRGLGGGRERAGRREDAAWSTALRGYEGDAGCVEPLPACLKCRRPGSRDYPRGSAVEQKSKAPHRVVVRLRAPRAPAPPRPPAHARGARLRCGS